VVELGCDPSGNKISLAVTVLTELPLVYFPSFTGKWASISAMRALVEDIPEVFIACILYFVNSLAAD
jgi:hypothetical protein